MNRFGVIAVLLCLICEGCGELTVPDDVDDLIGVIIKVEPGTANEATAYYQRIAGVTHFDFLSSDMDSLLAYLGYTGLLAKNLEEINSFTLMPRNAGEFAALSNAVASDDFKLELSDFQDDKVLVSRFFAPKIATYYDSNDRFKPIKPGEIVPGWRKLARLKSRAGSAADDAGIEHAYILFNIKNADVNADPFLGKESGNNQVIMVPRDQSSGDNVHFAVYGAKSAGYPIVDFLAADFDLPGHVASTNQGAEDSKYYVPRSCAQCHGHSFDNVRGQPVDSEGKPTDFATGKYPSAKPNYLDTDQWYDWMAFDFPGVSASPNDVVFDGGKDHGSADYARAFEVIRTLNETIRDETRSAEREPGEKGFQLLGAEKWLTLHANDDSPKPASVRSIGEESWNPNDSEEMRLLQLLDNHCFRCHSSVRYNVFDKKAVRERAAIIQVFLETKIYDQGLTGKRLPGFLMPQGRVLERAERDEMFRLIERVFHP